MSEFPIILVGFTSALPVLAEFLPPGSVVIIEEPDVARKREVRPKAEGSPLVRELIEWEYQLPGAADALAASRPELRAEAVIPLVEYATPFAARLAERLGVPGAGLGAAELMRDKSLLRRVTSAAGIPNPASEPVDGPQAVLRFMAAHHGPVVLKPANRQGAVGTMVLSDPAEVEQAWSQCQWQDEGAMVPDRARAVRMLVEEYVSGHEYSVEMVVRNGEPLFTNVTDKVLYPGPRPVELAHVLPAEIAPDLAELLHRYTARVLRAVGFGSGFVHCEWIVRDGIPHLVECAGRFPGDGIVEMIERAYGEPVGQYCFAVMRGHRPPPMPTAASQSAAVRFARVPPGVVVSVSGLDAARSIPGVLSCTLGVGVGDTVRELRSSWDRVGSATVLAPSAGEAMRLAEKAMEQVQIVTEPAGGAQCSSR